MNIFCTKPLSFGTEFIFMDAGTLLSWLPFAISHIIVEVYGKEIANKIAIFTAIICFGILLIGLIITYIPTTTNYIEQSNHFKYIFNNGPRIIVASFIAYLFSQIINIYIIDKLKNNIKSNIIIRGIFSSIISQFLDNLIFQLLAFAPIGLSLYEMRFYDIGTAIIITTIFEVVFESLFISIFTKKIISKIKEAI